MSCLNVVTSFCKKKGAFAKDIFGDLARLVRKGKERQREREDGCDAQSHYTLILDKQKRAHQKTSSLLPRERIRTELEAPVFARPGGHLFGFSHGDVGTAYAFPTLFAGERDADDDGIGKRRRAVTVEDQGVRLAAVD